MNKAYLFALTLVLFWNVGVAEEQHNRDHLEPVDGIYDIYDYRFEYGSKVRRVLFNGLIDGPEIRFLVKPSFTPENVLSIEFDRKNKKYYIIYHICEENIWYSKKWETIKVQKFKTEIDKESVALIKSLFDIAIAKVRFPEPEKDGLITSGADGTTYYFSIFKEGYGVQAGTVWSPKNGSKMNKLVAIGNQLIELAKSKEEIVKVDDELKKNIEKLIYELK